MPPKATAEGDNKQTIVALCNMMLSCPEFKIDTAALAPVLGVSHAKNVGRKINSLVGPYGFEYKGSKLIRKDDDAVAPATPTGTSADDSTTTSIMKKKSTPKTPASSKRSAAAAAPAKATATKTKVTKKRKLESDVASDEDDDESTVKTETKDVINTEDHPMSHVADDFEETTGDEGKGVAVKAEITTGLEED